MKTEQSREAWNKGNLVGQKPPLRPNDVWAIRIYLQNVHALRDLALFNLAIDSKLRGVILSACECAMSRTAIRSWRGRRSSSKRHNALSSLN